MAASGWDVDGKHGPHPLRSAGLEERLEHEETSSASRLMLNKWTIITETLRDDSLSQELEKGRGRSRLAALSSLNRPTKPARSLRSRSFSHPSNLQSFSYFHRLITMTTILISGAANGLGAAFVDAYAKKRDTRIIAIDRAPLQPAFTNVEPFTVDVTDETSINTFKQAISDRPIDLVIHSAGIRGLVSQFENEKPDDVAACETLEVMDTATLSHTFHINAIGTFNLVRALLPNLRRAANPKVITMSSRMGSLGNNERPNRAAGSAYAYRASKAAQNAVVRSFAVDVPEVTFVMCHPGRVETKLVRCREEGAISAEESVQAMVPLIEGWGREDSGKFFDRFGGVIPW